MEATQAEQLKEGVFMKEEKNYDFLYRMPSLIIGTLLETGQGRRSQESILSILKGTEKAGAPCDAKGLLLKSVQY